MCYEIQSSLSGLLDNLPNRPLAWILRLIIFPLGRRFRMPDDGLSMRIVDQLEENPEFRLDQCRGVYFRNDIDDVVGCLEIALESGRQTETVRRRLKEQGEKIPLGEDQEAWLTNLLTSNIISDDEHKKMQNYFENVHRAISVDSFESV